jgi:histidyl-tRNA synthetase
VFEFSSDDLGAQSQLGGGGRYDGLIEQLGGQPTPAVGWAAGIERILLAGALAPAAASPKVFIAPGERQAEAFALARRLRATGVTAVMEQAGRSLKGQLKQANRVGAAYTVIVSDDGYEVKDMATGEQRPVESAEAVLEAVR